MNRTIPKDEIHPSRLPESGDELFDFAPCGILYLSANGLVLRCNPEVLRWTGFEQDEVDKQMRLVDLLSSGGKILFETHVAPLLTVNGRVNGITLDLIGKGGAVIPVLLTAAQLQNATGPQVSRIILFDARDRRAYEKELLAARKQAENDSKLLSESNEQLRRAQVEVSRRVSQLERANEDLLHFAYAVSHDLKTPLRTVTSFVQLLELTYRDKLDAQAGEFVDFIVSGAARMGTMLNDLLQVAQAAGSPLQVQIETPLKVAVDTSLLSLRSAVDESGASVTYGDLPLVSGDPGQLTHLFQNLIGNAIKYRKPGVAPVVHISSERIGSDWVIAIKDNGIGFPTESAERIFGVFERLHQEQVEGTGIGLTICKRIVERNGGRIWASGQTGEGATFSFTIPADPLPFETESGKTLTLVQSSKPTPIPAPIANLSDPYFDELFQVLDLTQAMVGKLDGTILIWTQSCEQLFGWSKSEAIGQQSQALLKTEFPKPLSEIKSELLRFGKWSGELKRWRRDGSEVWQSSQWSLYRDGSGRPQSVIEVYADITARKQAELDLETSSTQRDLALQAGQMGIWQYDRQTGEVQWPESTDLVNGSPRAVQKSFHSFIELVHPEDRQKVQESIDAAFDKGPHYSVEFRLRKLDGDYIWLRGQGQVQLNRAQEPVGLIGVVWDISAAKQADEHLRLIRERLALGVEVSELALADITYDDGIIHLSAQAARCFGVGEQATSVPRELVHATFHPDDRQEILKEITACLDPNGPGWFKMEHRLVWPDRSVRWLSTRQQVFFAGSGAGRKPVRAILAAVDITERKQQELDEKFLLNLTAKLAQCSSPEDLTAAATTELSAYLGILRYTYAEVDVAGNRFEVLHTHPEDEGLQIGGFYPMDVFGDVLADLKSNRPAIIANTETDPRTAAQYSAIYKPREILSFLAIPLHREGLWVASFTVSSKTPRVWEPREIDLVRDVSERVWPAIANARLEQMNRLRQEQFEATFNQAAVGIAHVAFDGSWLRVNRRLCEITGYTEQELLAGGNFQETTHPDDLQLDLDQYEALKQGDIHSYSIEKRYFHKNGTIIWIKLTVSLVRPTLHTPGYAISVIEDINTQKRIEHDLKNTATLAAFRLDEIEAIYTSAPVGLAFVDKDLRFIRVNEHLASMEGAAPADYIGRTLGENFPELVPIYQGVIDSGRPVLNLELNHAPAAGPLKERTYLSSFYPLFDKASRVLGVNAVVQDITLRKLVEEDWIETAERLQIATAAAELGVFQWDFAQDRIHWENVRAYEIIGRKNADGVFSSALFFDTVVHPDDKEKLEKALANTWREGGRLRHECRIYREDGTLRIIEVFGIGDTNSEGLPLPITGVIADITDRKQTEQYQQIVFDLAPVGMCYIDTDIRFTKVNQKMCEITGYSAAEMAGMKVADLTHPDDVPGHEESMITFLKEEGRAVYQMEKRYLRKDGSFRWVSASGKRVLDPEGQHQYSIGTVVDIHDRKLAEEATRESDQHFRLLAESAPLGIFRTDARGASVYVNSVWCSMAGLSEAESMGSGWEQAIYPEDRADAVAGWTAAASKGCKWVHRHRILNASGAVRWVEARSAPTTSPDGELIGHVVTIADITDWKVAEESLAERDRQLLSMMDSIDQLAWIAHADGYIFWYNQRWYDYTGTTPEQMEGWGWQAVHDPKVLPEVLERWPEAIRTGEPFDMEFPLRGADGVYRSFLTRAVPFRNSAGRVVRWFGTNTNVDALRKQQNMLLENEQRFRELAEKLPDFVWVADSDGKLTYLSPRWQEYTGVPSDVSLSESRASRIIHPNDHEAMSARWNKSVETGQPFLKEVRLRRHDGTYRWFLSQAEPVTDSAGNIAKWVGSATDIHEQKITEQALRRSNENLEQFTFAASHDLREPLRMVSIYTQLLVENYGDKGPEARQLLNYVVDGVNRMEMMLKAILAFSRAGEPPEPLREIDSNAVLSQVLVELQAVISGCQATITYDPLPVVQCTSAHLHNLLQNLIANALNYRSEKPLFIHISAVLEGTHCRFSVKDNGIGIAPQYLEQIFGIFKRLHKSDYPGVGIGLAICKRIVQQYEGKIWAESILGKGATFHFTLPSVAPQTPLNAVKHQAMD